ncbi:MAG: alpha/beta hydrolase [Paludibacteraceae bacterium]|nr:alpha/beta hydrolase [Paludibacteraceae bacterium]
MNTRKCLLAAFCAMSLNAFPQGWGFGGFGNNGSSGLDSYTSKKDVNYVGDGKGFHAMDIYYPKEAKESYPVVIHIYGSAWSSNNSKGSADLTTVGEGALKAGYIFVTPNHRANNDAQWPGQINDIKAVVRYLRGNAESLKVDTSFIAISGFSSGGHLATMMGTSRNVREYTVGNTTMDIEGNLGQFTDFSSSVDAVCDWSGPVILNKLNCGSAMDLNSFISPMMGNCSASQCPDKYALATAVTFMDPTDPPYLLVHGSADNIVAQCQSELLYNELKKNDIECQYIPTGSGHGVNADKVPDMIEFFNKARVKKMEALEATANPFLNSDVAGSLTSVNFKNGILTLSGSDSFSFKVVDIVGKVVFCGTYKAVEQSYNLSEIAAGLYILTTDSGINHKFIR